MEYSIVKKIEVSRYMDGAGCNYSDWPRLTDKCWLGILSHLWALSSESLGMYAYTVLATESRKVARMDGMGGFKESTKEPRKRGE